MNPNENQTTEIQVYEKKAEELMQCLEKKENFMGSKIKLLNYQNFWCRADGLKHILHYQAHFRARDSDIILASLPKTGTTWMKSLLFSIMNRGNPDHQPLKKKSPLLTHNPHELVYYLELGVYKGGNPHYPTPQQLDDQLTFSSRRLLHTHIPYTSQPESIKTSSCKIVYIARNPLDTFVSQWYWFMDVLRKLVEESKFQLSSMEDYFEEFCLGIFPYGPYFDHVLEFWNQSLEQPNKVLFVKYEDLKGDQAVVHLKKLAEFVGHPFSNQEESEGVVNDIMELCSINNLKELEVNKTNKLMSQYVEKKNFFRKGEVGDWTNYFTPSMIEKINVLMQEKLEGSGLSFEMLKHY